MVGAIAQYACPQGSHQNVESGERSIQPGEEQPHKTEDVQPNTFTDSRMENDCQSFHAVADNGELAPMHLLPSKRRREKSLAKEPRAISRTLNEGSKSQSNSPLRRGRLEKHGIDPSLLDQRVRASFVRSKSSGSNLSQLGESVSEESSLAWGCDRFPKKSILIQDLFPDIVDEDVDSPDGTAQLCRLSTSRNVKEGNSCRPVPPPAPRPGRRKSIKLSVDVDNIVDDVTETFAALSSPRCPAGIDSNSGSGPWSNSAGKFAMGVPRRRSGSSSRHFWASPKANGSSRGSRFAESTLEEARANPDSLKNTVLSAHATTAGEEEALVALRRNGGKSSDRMGEGSCTGIAATQSARVEPIRCTMGRRRPQGLSLNVGDIEQDSKSISSRIRSRGNMEMYKSVCSKITDFLYVGGSTVAQSRDELKRTGVTHIINCAGKVAPEYFPDDFKYCTFCMNDHDSQEISGLFYSAIAFIEKARQSGGKVFIHCLKGISRSPAIAIAYLVWWKNWDFDDAYKFVKQARPVVDPNPGFVFQLNEWQNSRPSIQSGAVLFSIGVCPPFEDDNLDEKGLRVCGANVYTREVASEKNKYGDIRVCSHSQDTCGKGEPHHSDGGIGDPAECMKPNDVRSTATHVEEHVYVQNCSADAGGGREECQVFVGTSGLRKELAGCLGSATKSGVFRRFPSLCSVPEVNQSYFANPSEKTMRRSFILCGKGSLFVWYGKCCAEAYRKGIAALAVTQLQRFEGAPSTCHYVNQGEEPEEFWDELQTLRSLEKDGR